jgi:glycosyltransferase involved in cell wall biosynthesis
MKTSLRLLHDAGIPVLYMLHDRWVLYERAGPWLRPWPTIDRAGFAAVREGVARLGRPRIELGAPPIERQGINCFVTQWLEDEHRRLGWRPRVTHVVRGGFDLEPFRNAAATRAPAAPPRRLVFAGRVDRRKGLDTAVRGIAEAGLGHKLVVAGPIDDDSYRAKVEGLAAQLGVAEQVECRGPLPRAELPALFAESDAMVYPSTEPESYGLGLIEAMAAGRPVITSALGGPREYLRDGKNALLFAPRDHAGLARALQRLEEEPELVVRLAEASAATAAEHGIEPVVDHVESLLVEALPQEGAQSAVA